MLATLRTSFVDSRSDALTWRTGLPPQPALARRAFDLGLGVRAELRVLGASHQVILAAACRGGDVCSETVACIPGRPGRLPAHAVARTGGWEYEFGAVIESFDARGFTARVRALCAHVAAHPRGIAAAYPGAADAVTALVVERRGDAFVWSTWHTYPQERRIVKTRSRAA